MLGYLSVLYVSGTLFEKTKEVYPFTIAPFLAYLRVAKGKEPLSGISASDFSSIKEIAFKSYVTVA